MFKFGTILLSLTLKFYSYNLLHFQDESSTISHHQLQGIILLNFILLIPNIISLLGSDLIWQILDVGKKLLGIKFIHKVLSKSHRKVMLWRNFPPKLMLIIIHIFNQYRYSIHTHTCTCLIYIYVTEIQNLLNPS